jgi:hypothetical protein
MSSLVPIGDRGALKAITAAVDTLPKKLGGTVGGPFIDPRHVLTRWNSKAAFDALTGRWTCAVRRSMLRFEQIDWENTLLSIAAQPEPLKMVFSVREDIFEIGLSGVYLHGFRHNSKMKFRINDGPIKSVTADLQPDGGWIVVHTQAAVTLS